MRFLGDDTLVGRIMVCKASEPSRLLRSWTGRPRYPAGASEA